MTALDGVTLDVARGRFTAIMGASGSGKSTLLHCLAGLDKPTRGKVLLGTTDLTRVSERKLTRLRRDRIGFVFQSYDLLPQLTVRQNILLPIEVAGAKVDPPWLDTVLEALELGDLLRQLPSQLSGGEQQRVAVARAVLPRPDVVLADEPTGALDAGTTREMVGFLRASVDHLGQTVVMVTHDPLAAQHTDRAVILHEGRLVGEVAQPTAHGVLDALAALADTAGPAEADRRGARAQPPVRAPRPVPLAVAAPARGPARLTAMPAAVLRAVITQSWDRPLRQLLVGLVVMVATAFAAASVMLTGAAGATIVRELAGTPQAAARRRAGRPDADPAQPAGLPADLEQKVRDTPGVAAVAPFETSTVAVSRPGAAGDGEVWNVVTAADGPLGRFPAVTGALPAGPDEAAISEAAARRTGLQVGDTFTLVGAAGLARTWRSPGWSPREPRR